jgi:SNF2 family DNA or RNA helicase
VLDKEGEAIDKWNAGEIPMLLAHPASSGHGVNLQHGGATAVWYGLNWSLELYEQFNGRLHRQGQRNAVRVIHIVAAGCIDERVMQAIQGKARTQKELIDALKI